MTEPVDVLLEKAKKRLAVTDRLERWARVCEERIEGESYLERKARLDEAFVEIFGSGEEAQRQRKLIFTASEDPNEPVPL